MLWEHVLQLQLRMPIKDDLLLKSDSLDFTRLFVYILLVVNTFINTYQIYSDIMLETYKSGYFLTESLKK